MGIDKIDLVGHLNVRSPEAFVNQKYLQVEVRIAFVRNIAVQTSVMVVDTFGVVGTFVAVDRLIGPSLTGIVLAAVVVMWPYNPFVRLEVAEVA